jgi:tetratricopeptide (TPR) repeat protein
MTDASHDDRTVPADDSAGPRPAPAPRAGDRLGRYVLGDCIGQGGMGSVWAAHDPELGREIAIKVVRADAHDASWRARVLREAQSLARLAHPHVVPIYDVGVGDGVLWLAMQRVRGPSLAQWLEVSRAWPEVLDAFVQAARGLAAAHACGLVHRDFKPANAMFDGERVFVLDFGLAWAPGVDGARPTIASGGLVHRDAASGRDPLAITLTASDAVVGTLPYMAPEQHAVREVDARCDQYAWCVSLYEGIFGARPFEGDLERLLAAKRRGPPAAPPAVGHGVPEALWQVIARGLEPDPARRWPDLATMLDAIARLRAPRRAWPWAAGVVLAGGLVATGIALPPAYGGSCDRAEAIDAVWSASRRERLAQSFAGLGEGGREVFSRLQPRIAAAIADWRAQAQGLCDAPAPREASNTAMCLDHAAVALDASLAVFDELDATRAARSVRLVEGVLAEHDCEREAAVTTAMADETRRDYARARALMVAGALDRARELGEQMGRDAIERGDRNGEAWAMLVRGGAELDMGEVADARTHLVEAQRIATAEGDDRAATTAAIKLVHLCAIEFDPACADQWLRVAESGLPRLGDDERAQASRELDLARGDAALRSGQAEAALDHYHRALASLRASPGDHAVMEVVLLHAIGLAHADAGRHEAALAHFDEADGIESRELGERDTSRVMTLELRAGSLYALGRIDEARAATEAALVNLDAAYGEGHPHAVRMRGNLVLLLLASHELEAALALAEQVVARKRELFGAEHVQVAIGLLNLGEVSSALGRHDDALEQYDESLRLWSRTVGDQHVDLAGPLAGRANAELALGDAAAARADAERAAALLEQAGRELPAQLRDDLAAARARAPR